MSDENWLATPFDDDILSFWDIAKVYFNLGHGKNVGRGRHVDEEICNPFGQRSLPVLTRRALKIRSSFFHASMLFRTLNGSLCTSSSQKTHGADHEILEDSVGALSGLAPVCGEIGNFIEINLILGFRSKWRLEARWHVGNWRTAHLRAIAR